MTQELTISIIAEGPTDFEVLTTIITSFTENKDILYTPLQPKRADNGEWEDGNWDKVVKYCASDDFKGAVTATNNFIIIQIDTDWLLGDSVPENYRIAHISQMSAPEIIESARGLLISQISKDFYNEYADRIIFAIAVEAIECWFLAIYFPNEPKKAAKHTNCIDNLNKPLYQKEEFYIDSKDLGNYRKICKHFKKKKDLLVYCEPNESFKAFISELDNKLPKPPIEA